MSDQKAKDTKKKEEGKTTEVVVKATKAAKKDLPRSLKELKTLVMSNSQLIYCISSEEDRMFRDFREHIALPNGIELLHWSAYTGIIRDADKHNVLNCNMDKKGEFKGTNDVRKALDTIAEYSVTDGAKGAVFVMKDMHTVFTEPIPRQMKDVIQWLVKREHTMPIIILITAPELGYSSGRANGLPLTLEKEVVVVDYDLLTRMELESIVNTALKEINAVKKSNPLDISNEEVQAIARAGQGMTFDEFRRSMATSIIETGTIDVDAILYQKKQAIKKSEVLEIINIDGDISQVGGLDAAKEYFEQYKSAFTDEAKEYGVEALKGVVLTGIPGTGKSLFCKAAAKLWQLPILRMDVGKVMGSLVGESERRMRDALKHAAACAPCILWIDEIEKAMSGTQSSAHTDGGTTSRVFGTMLTWMQECEDDVVVLATANNINGLPPELIRRFNEVFYVDLPIDTERVDIFNIHLRKRGRDPKNFDMKALIKASDGFTGAEIEKSIKEAIANAYTAGSKDVKNAHMLKALKETKPIATQMADQIAEVRAWADGRARYASYGALALKEKNKKETTADLDSGLGDLANLVTKEDGKQAESPA